MNGTVCIEVRDLSHTYEGGEAALRGVSLEITRGEFLAVIGRNGSGKTTLVKHFNGLLKPTGGQVLVEGEDTRRLSIGQLARRVGLLFQNPDHQIFARSVRDEVAFGPLNLGLDGAEVEERAGDALARFGLEEYAQAPPAVLSYGLRRKVTLASIYSMRPPVMVLDEPTTGLDHKSALDFMEMVEAFRAEGNTAILVTHDMRLVARFAGRVVLMDGGRVMRSGPTREVLADEELLRGTSIRPPQITRLARQMAGYGIPPDALSVAEFYRAYRKTLWGVR